MAKQQSKLPELKRQIREKTINGIYLFYGEEVYIKENYIEKISALIDDGGFEDFNRIVIDAKKTDFSEIDDAVESFPFMCDRKIVIIKDSGIFQKSNEEQREYWAKRLDNIPDYAVLIFDENGVDKRSALYKKAAKKGLDVEFCYMQASELVTWVEKEVLNEKKKINKSVAEYFVSLCDEGMSNIKNELDKLLCYCETEITKSDVDRLVSKAIGVRVFELTDCIMAKNTDGALTILNELKTIKEPAFKILYLLFSTFDKMLRTLLLLNEGENFNDIAVKIGTAPFVAKKYADSARGLGEKFLTDRVIQTANIDLAIKNGEIGDWEALENYVIESCYKII